MTFNQLLIYGTFKNTFNFLQYLRVNGWCTSSDYVACCHIICSASKICNYATRFFYHYDSGSYVPWAESDLKERLAPAAGQVCQIKGGRTGPPDVTYPEEDILEEFK